METATSRENYLSQTITNDNIILLEKHIAFRVLRSTLHFTGNSKMTLIRNLRKDCDNEHNPEHAFSNAYDLVQTASAFLYEYLNKPLKAPTGKLDKNKRPISVYNARYKDVSKLLYSFSGRKIVDLHEEKLGADIVNTRPTNETYILEQILNGMNLTVKENDTLDARWNGAGYRVIGKEFNVTFNSIFARCKNMQKKYKQFLINNGLYLQQCDKCKQILRIVDYKSNEIHEKSYCYNCEHGKLSTSMKYLMRFNPEFA